MADVYKLLATAICESIEDEWEKVTVKIESSLNKMCSFQTEYTLASSEKKELKFPLLTANDLMDSVFELQESMLPEHKWNKAVYTLEKNGHFDMTFEWNQALQDEWDNA